MQKLQIKKFITSLVVGIPLLAMAVLGGSSALTKFAQAAPDSFGYGDTGAIITLTKYQVSVGDTFRINGRGWDAGENVTINFAGQIITITANGNGRFTTTPITAPASTAGTTVHITAVGDKGNSDYADLIVNAFEPAAFSSSYDVFANQTVTLTGRRFAPNEVVTITEGSTVIGIVNTTGNGRFVYPHFVVPGPGPTTHTYVFTGSISHTPDSLTITVHRGFGRGNGGNGNNQGDGDNDADDQGNNGNGNNFSFGNFNFGNFGRFFNF